MQTNIEYRISNIEQRSALSWRLALIVSLLLSPVFPAVAQEQVSLAIQEKWSNVYGDQECVFHAELSSREGFAGRLGWQFDTHGRTLRPGEAQIAVPAGASLSVKMRVAVPPVKTGVTVSGTLAVRAYEEAGDKLVASLRKDICVFSRDAFADRGEWLKALNIRLLDPKETTGEILEKANVPFGSIGSIDALPEVKTGLIIIGEGVSFRDYRALGEMMVRAAAAGRFVLCLAPEEGEIAVPGMGQSELPEPEAVHLRRQDVIRSLNKKLDADAWPPDGKVVNSRLNLLGERGPVIAEITDGQSGWSWVEIEYEGGGRLVICGFAIIEKWETGPTPRYLLLSILERMGRGNGREEAQEAQKGAER